MLVKRRDFVKTLVFEMVEGTVSNLRGTILHI